MVKATFTQPDGSDTTLDLEAGYSLMEEAVRLGIEGIDAECGGSCACGTCHVLVDEDWFSRLAEPDEDEAAMLELVAHPGPTSRLACQIKLTANLDGIRVRIPLSQS